MTRKLVLHIGSHKTGTTSLQYYLDSQRGQLKENGVHYCGVFRNFTDNHSVPVASMFKFRPETYAHNVKAGLNREQVKELNRQNFRALEKDILSLSDCTYVISGEDIALLKNEEISRLGSFVGQHFTDVKIVYCVRSPLDVLSSSYLQGLKNGLTSNCALRTKGIAKRYYDIPRRFSDAFGRENMLIYRYEDALSTGGIISYFCEQVLGVPYITKEKKRHNPSISANAAKLLEYWNSIYEPEDNIGKTRPLGLFVRRACLKVPGPKFVLSIPELDSGISKINLALENMRVYFGIEPYEPIISASEIFSRNTSQP